MHITWEAKDIIPGRMICKQFKKPLSPGGWEAKWTLKIGFHINHPNAPLLKNEETGEYLQNNLCLISMSDGMITKPMSAEDLAAQLNKDEMIPMPHDWLIAIINFLRGIHENSYTYKD